MQWVIWLRRLVCFLIGHHWDGVIDPECMRCPYKIERTGYVGEVYIGWGRLGTLTAPPEKRS